MREYKIVYGSKSCKLSRQKNPVVLQEIRYESETTPISVFAAAVPQSISRKPVRT